MKTVLVPVLCLLLTTPLSAATPDERFTTAQEQMRAGNLAIALTTFETLRTEFPNNVDYVFALAIVLTEVGRHEEALTQLEYAISLSPNYEDVWRTKYNLLLRSADAEEIGAFRELSAARFPSSTWWRISAPDSRYPWLVTLGAGIDSLNNSLPNWDRQFAEIRFQRNETQSYAVNFSRDSRNNLSDFSTGLMADWTSGHWLAGGSMVFADNPDIMPETGIELYGGRQFPDGWVATIRYRHRDYANATVSSFFAGTEKYFGDFRIAYDLGVSRLHGDSGYLNHVIVGNWYYSEMSSIGLSMTAGREAEPIGGGQVLETDVKGISLRGRQQFNERFGLHWWLGVHDQGQLYRRQFVGMAFSIRI